MLPANLISALQVLTRSDRPLISASKDAPQSAAQQLQVGQRLQGQVQSEVSQGLFKVQVAGSSLQMRLPGNIKGGDTIELEVVTVQPRITFSIAASTNPLPTADKISSSARMLSDLANLPMERPVVQQAGGKAVFAAEQVQQMDTKQLAGSLRDAIGKSGLFYESHQAQWVRGERSTGQLLEEPQNQLMKMNAGALSGENQSVKSQLAESNSAQLTKGSADTALLAAKNAADSGLSVNKQLLPLVQQQLHTLENHHLAWSGQVWPKQEMLWEIKGEQQPNSYDPDSRQWSTELELSLPNLGDVRARLVLTPKGLQMSLRAAETGTVDLFTQSAPNLRMSMAEANIALTSLAVEKAEYE
ncbi:MAG: flagellar hook-length control protein FliK [Gallionella sp.]|nr:flagellar hook-length control protein FliK [Gallionella sp.]